MNFKKKISNSAKKAFRTLFWHMPIVILIFLIVFFAVTLNLADKKILSSYEPETETVIVYNGLKEDLTDISITVNLKQDGAEGVAIKLTVPHLGGYKENRISIYNELPHGFNVKVTKVTIKAFKLNYWHCGLMLVCLIILLVYCKKFRKYLLF